MHTAIHGFTKHAWHVLLAASLVCIGLAGCGGPADSSSVTHVSAAKMSGQAADQVIPNSCAQTGQGCGGGSVRYPDPGLYLVAGHTGGSGSVDGKRAAARFQDPTGLAMDRAGNLYVADTFNSTIRKITPSGTVSTLAGKAGVEDSADGTGGAAHFNRPYGIAADARGNLYVADTYNHAIRRITATGVVTTIAGAAGIPGSTDGTGTAARFAYPGAIAVDRAGNLYVTDNFSTVRKISPAGVVSTLAGTAGVGGSADGAGPAAQFSEPTGIAVDDTGTLYVTDMFNDTIRKITPAGVVSTLAGAAGVSGSADGTGAAARFYYPQGITVGHDGTLYVGDTYNQTVRTITPDGTVRTLAGSAGAPGSADGMGAAARFNGPWGIAVDADHHVYVADTANGTIRLISPTASVTTVAGYAAVAGGTDGFGAMARFSRPQSIALDASGNMYVADSVNNTIRKLTPAGQVTTLAGTAGLSGSADGSGAAARFNYPTSVAVDAAGNTYVADYYNRTVRKISAAGLVSTLAGTAGLSGSADGTGSAGLFNRPAGVAVDMAGNVYVADSANCNIRRITPAGVVTTLAGMAGVFGSADGTGLAAQFSEPNALALDAGGNLYVTDTGNHTIRKITPSGTVSTLAGSAGVRGSADGIGSAARFFLPMAIAVDAGNQLWVADTYNHTIRLVTPSGAVSTVAGVPGQGGVVLGALPGGLSSPAGVAVAGAHTLVLTSANSVLRLVLPGN